MTLSGIATDETFERATTADDERRLLRTAVLRTEEQRLVHIITAFLESDGDASLAARIVCTAPLTGLSKSIMQTLTFMDDDIATESVTRYK